MGVLGALTEDELAGWLSRLIAIASVSGSEAEALAHVEAQFARVSPDVFRMPFPGDLSAHEEYLADPLVEKTPERANVIVRWPGCDPAREAQRLILQTHVDTVPLGGWDDGCTPLVEAGRVVGRGACDCKGQVVMLYQMARLLGGPDFRPPADLEIQLVSEEEVGGNGALACVLARPRAGGVVVCEPTGLRLFAANRGALWFRIDIEGRSVHMGRKWEGKNAIELACAVIAQLGRYERQLLAESRDVPLFEEYETPVQVNVGTIRGGDWPAAVAGECAIEGGVGFLPNKDRAALARELRALLEQNDDPWLRDHARVSFDRLRNEAFVTPVDHPLVRTFSATLAGHGYDARPAGWNVSCDARLYATVGRMPAVVFGAGDIAQAHSRGEWIELAQVERGAQVLADFVRAWFARPG